MWYRSTETTPGSPVWGGAKVDRFGYLRARVGGTTTRQTVLYNGRSPQRGSDGNRERKEFEMTNNVQRDTSGPPLTPRTFKEWLNGPARPRLRGRPHGSRAAYLDAPLAEARKVAQAHARRVMAACMGVPAELHSTVAALLAGDAEDRRACRRLCAAFNGDAVAVADAN